MHEGDNNNLCKLDWGIPVAVVFNKKMDPDGSSNAFPNVQIISICYLATAKRLYTQTLDSCRCYAVFPQYRSSAIISLLPQHVDCLRCHLTSFWPFKRAEHEIRFVIADVYIT